MLTRNVRTTGTAQHVADRPPRRRRLAAVLLVGAVVLSGCADDPDVDAVAADVEQLLRDELVPVLAEQGTDAALDALDDTVRQARTPELLVSLGSRGGGSGSATTDHVQGIVSIVGEDRGACLGVYVDADGDVRVLGLHGDPATGCADAALPEDWS